MLHLKTKLALKQSCLNNNLVTFIPFLMQRKVKTAMPNKMKFYWFLRGMLCKAHDISKNSKNVTFSSNNKENGVTERLELIDSSTGITLLSILISEKKETIHFETLPF